VHQTLRRCVPLVLLRQQLRLRVLLLH
jgi:hypothetical protein